MKKKKYSWVGTIFYNLKDTHFKNICLKVKNRWTCYKCDYPGSESLYDENIDGKCPYKHKDDILRP